MKKNLFILLFASMTLASCVKDPDIDSMTITITEPNVSYSCTSATIQFSINSPHQQLGTTGLNATIYYSTTEDFKDTANNKAVGNINQHKVTAGLSELDDNTRYFYRIKIHNSVSSAEYGPYDFTTLKINSPIPSETTITQISYNTAVFSCTITQDGGAEITENGFCWGTSPNPTLESCIGYAISSPIDGTSFLIYSPDNLIGGTKYYVRAYAKNTKLIGYGETAAFTTTAYNNPVVVTSSVPSSNIGYTSATLSGSVTSAGSESIVNRGFYYSTSPNPNSTGQKVNASGTSLGSFNHTINGLQTGTTYYYCAYAVNSQGMEGIGSVMSFTTK